MSYQRLNPQAVTGTPTLASGVAYDSDTRFGTKLVKFGNIVVFCTALQLTDSGAHFGTTYTNVMTLPAGFRPATRLFVPAVVGTSIWNASDPSKMQFEPSTGMVSVYCATSRTDLTHVQAFAVFTV